MKSSKKNKLAVLISLILMGVLPLLLIGQLIIEIQVAPNVLNLQNQGQVVTIHTDIPYSQVSGSSVTLNGVEIDHWKSDNRGFFVAKFVMSAIKNLPLNIDEYNTMTVEGVKTDGTSFIGESEILVINKKGRN